MAVIMNLRKRVGLLVGVIAVSILAFLLMDSFNGQNRVFGGGVDNSLGSVNGTEIDGQRYARKLDNVNAFYEYWQGRWKQQDLAPRSDAEMNQLRQTAWNELVEDEILTPQYNDLGIAITPSEMGHYLSAPRKVNGIAYTFYREMTGQQFYDPNVMKNLLSQVNAAPAATDAQSGIGHARAFYQQLEPVMRREIMKGKFINMIQKSTYVPDWMAKDAIANSNNTANGKVVALPVSQVKNDEVTIDDSDYANYLRANAKKYDRGEARQANLVVFDIIASASDSANARKVVTDKMAKWQTSSSDSAFMALQANNTYNGGYMLKDQITTSIVDTFFSASTGSFFGPFIEGGMYKTFKLIDRAQVYDTIDVQRIFVATREPGQTAAAKAKADSLMTALRSGTPFDTLAVKHSDDFQTSARGGVITALTPNLVAFPLDLHKQLFTRQNTGDVVMKQYPSGVYIVKVTDTKNKVTGVSIASVERKIKPSDVTRQQAYNKAGQFLREARDIASFDSTANKMGLVKRNSGTMDPGTYRVSNLPAGGRNIVRWAFNAQVNDVKLFTEFANETNGDKYVVAVLTEAYEDGAAPTVEQYKTQIDYQVRNEKKVAVLAEKMKTAINGAASIDEVANKLGVNVTPAINVNAANGNISGISREPEVAGILLGLADGEKSGVIEGKNGVYMVEKTNSINATIPENLDAKKTELKGSIQNANSANVINALRSGADVNDTRYKSY